MVVVVVMVAMMTVVMADFRSKNLDCDHPWPFAQARFALRPGDVSRNVHPRQSFQPKFSQANLSFRHDDLIVKLQVQAKYIHSPSPVQKSDARYQGLTPVMTMPTAEAPPSIVRYVPM